MWLPNIIGTIDTRWLDTSTGAFRLDSGGTNRPEPATGTVGGTTNRFNASWYSSVYTDNGKVMPLSISKQSYIIYK